MTAINQKSSLGTDVKKQVVVGKFQGMFSLSEAEIKTHVDAAATLSFWKTFRASIIIFSIAILLFSFLVLAFLFPNLGMGSSDDVAGQIITFVIYGTLLIFVGLRHRWALFAWGSLFIADHIMTLVDISAQTKHFNVGALFMKFYFCLYASSLVWKAFLVEQALRKRAAAPVILSVPVPPSV